MLSATAPPSIPNPTDAYTLVPETDGIRALLRSTAFVGDEVAAVATLVQVLSGATYDGNASVWPGTLAKITNAHLVQADRADFDSASAGGDTGSTLSAIAALIDQYFAYCPGTAPPATIADVIAQVTTGSQAADPPVAWDPPTLPDFVLNGQSDLVGAIAGLAGYSAPGLHDRFRTNKATAPFIGAGLFPPPDEVESPPAILRQKGQ